MPPSPSDGRSNSKWKKRKPNRRQKQEEEDEDEEQQEEEMDREDDHEEPPQEPDLNPRESEVLLGGGVRVSDFPSVVRHAVNRPHSSVLGIAALERANSLGENRTSALQNGLVLENVSYGQLQALSVVPADSSALDLEKADGSSSYVITPPPIMEGRGVVKRFGTRVHVLPMHSEWFSPGAVNRLERQVVPHFFSGKSPDHTPEKYMECRNFVVAKYMENPEKRLAVSDFQGLIVGIENEDLTRIVRFLDQWGIINYCALALNTEHCNGNSSLREDPNGELCVPSDALKSIDSLIKFDKPKCRLKAAEVYSLLPSHNDNDSDLDSKIRERLSENHCNCCSQPLPIVYYQSHKEVDVLLCSDCFHEGRFVNGHSSIDFVKVDSTKDYGEPDVERWTDRETLMLLEAMEIYNDNWNEISDHVGTKSKAQCILHFVRLPIEEGVLDNIEVPSLTTLSNSLNGDGSGRMHLNSNGNLAASRFQVHESESRLPFENSGNPVMSLVAFLASAVGPRVAAACAHASLAALSEDDGLATSVSMAQIEETRHGHRINSESIQNRENSYGETANFSQNEADGSPLSTDKVKAAAKAGIAAAATKAKLFADHEEREIQRLSANIINHQLKRLELKLKQFAEVETMLMKECEQVEKARQRFAAERTRIVSARFGPAVNTSPMSATGLVPTTANNNSSNNRPQVMSTSSLPHISGYGNNQPVHPHMPFSPQRQMFGFGQQLPTGSIQVSPSTAPNANFHSPGNPQPPQNHPMLRPMPGTSGSGLG